MPESCEHTWLSDEFLRIVSAFSSLDLYSYKETSRKRYDFSCELKRDFTNLLVGQTLWKHHEGIDKDVRTLLGANEAQVTAYIARDNTKNRTLLREVIEDFRSLPTIGRVERLKIFWVPENFEVGDPEGEESVRYFLRSQVTNDILMNVVFGRINADDIRFFLTHAGIPGLNYAMLLDIAINGFDGLSSMSKRLDVAPATMRPRYTALLGSGFVTEPYEPVKAGHSAYVSPKGRVFIELTAILLKAVTIRKWSEEADFLFGKLGLSLEPFTAGWDPDVSPDNMLPILNASASPGKFTQLMAFEALQAQQRWVNAFAGISFVRTPYEDDPEFAIKR